jgi:hypothetical protein
VVVVVLLLLLVVVLLLLLVLLLQVDCKCVDRTFIHTMHSPTMHSRPMYFLQGRVLQAAAVRISSAGAGCKNY